MVQSQLHPGVRWQFRIRSYIVLFILSVFTAAVLIPKLSDSFDFTFEITPGSGLVTLVVYIVAILLLGDIYARLAYNNWMYEFTDEGLRAERGIIWKRYSNVPYERIQNVDIHRGIIARMLGFSSIMIQTAGYSGQLGSEGYIPAVGANTAEQIREFLMKKITKRK
ncbi:PH domain-containing protein [Candidatus Pacearchaeota archaeon]|nr:PH domain-containing protein [Candidatus Pacearchaeota archaeon]